MTTRAPIETPRFDRFLSRYFPGWAARRQTARFKAAVAREALLRIEAATIGTRTQNWFGATGSINTETELSLDRLRARSRDLVLNNQDAAAAVDVLQSKIIGVGIQPRARASSRRREQRAQVLWQSHAETPAICPEGRHTIYALQSLAWRAVMESGEVLLQRVFRPSSSKLEVPLHIRLLEADHLDSGKNEADGERIIVQGVEFDTTGRRVAYWLFPEHPGEANSFRNFESRRVPAEDIAHVFETLRPGQVRGIPRGTSCLLRVRDWDAYADAQLIRQQLAACFTAFVTDIDGDAVTGAGSSVKPTIESLNPGLIEWLPTGKTITFASPPQVEGFKEYAEVTQQSIARGYRVSYEELTGDYSRVNFSSARMSRQNLAPSTERVRQHYALPGLCLVPWRWFLEAANAAGSLDTIEVGATWYFNRTAIVDPSKEVPALVREVRAGMRSLSEVIRESGRDPRRVLEELAEDYQMIDELGLVLESDGRNPTAGSASAGGSSEASGEEGEEQESEEGLGLPLEGLALGGHNGRA